MTGASETQPAVSHSADLGGRLDVRRLREEDIPALLVFLAEHYPDCPAKANADYFRWRFAAGPFGSSLDYYWLAWIAGQIAGQLATIRDRLWLSPSAGFREPVEALWLVDLFVTPAHRGELTALRMFQALMNSGLLLLATGAGSAVEPLYRALGWQRRSIAQSLYLPIRPAGLLRMAAATGRTTTRMRMLQPAASAAGLLLPSMLGYLKPRNDVGEVETSIEPLPRIAEKVAALFDALRPQLGVTEVRNAEVFGWKFAQCPRGRRLAVTARDPGNAALRGYLLAKEMERPGVARWIEVVDYLAGPDDAEAFAALEKAIVHKALLRRVDFVRWRLSQPLHLQRLARPWWQQRTMPVSDDVFAYSSNADLLAAFDSPWHLTSLASDRADYGGDDLPSD